MSFAYLSITGRHLLQDALRNLILLLLELVLCIFAGALQALLLGLDGLHQVARASSFILSPWVVELLLQVLDLGVQVLQLGTLRFKFLLQRFEIAGAFVSADDRLLDVDDADL